LPLHISTNIENAIKEKNISFYNAIAGNYEAMLEEQSFNKIVRQIVADKFYENVKEGNVLDFGGGTGLDLKWLAYNNYHLFFCEPSTGMRKKAIAYKATFLSNKDIFFLDDDTTDYTNWCTTPPFKNKMDAVLSNFAVINCIPDIELLFKNLASVMNPGGNLVALVLDDRKRMAKFSIKNIIKSFILQKTITMPVKYNGNEHTVFIYSMKKLRKAAAPYFNFCSHEYLTEYGFCLIHLTKK
jgi:SAM-dependent methyltransferase